MRIWKNTKIGKSEKCKIVTNSEYNHNLPNDNNSEEIVHLSLSSQNCKNFINFIKHDAKKNFNFNNNSKILNITGINSKENNENKKNC